ncbi:8286_t:CDS:2 [Paraglomus brasilianum]|uniref:8286_t:CDS:1 n=1 Tax=Paraglomus brasilianum TaxID=144538 RepID=A0A9N9AIH6_9GLOM|nr:8286_t:CDS:2 [Paraglomus brasilianum]
MALVYDALKTKWQKRQDTETVVFGATRDAVVTKLNRLVQTKVAALKGGMFTDEEWNIKKYPMVALYQNNRSPTEKDISFTSEYKCIERLSPQSTFYVDKAKPGDVKQGEDGDCWFLAVLAAAADVPHLVRSLVVFDDKAKIYGFVFYNDGWVGTIVDNYVFYHDVWSEKTNSFETVLKFSEADGNETWAPLLEKAFAKINGDYESIDGSCGLRALVGLGGINYKDCKLAQYKVEPKKTELWNAFLAATKNHNTIFACSRDKHHDEMPNSRGEDTVGLVPGHMYSFLRAVNFHNNKLVEIRNPWAMTEWNGKWSDKSSEWAPYKQKDTIPELNYSLVDDGSFFMLFDDFLCEFDEVESCEYPVAVATSLNKPASISTDSLVTASWWHGTYNIYHADKVNMSDLSGVQLTFGSDGTTVKVNGSGTDDKGNYTIVNSSYDSSSKKISFTKQYKVNANMARNYQGIYHSDGDLFSGTWGDAKNPNTGNFLIHRISLGENQWGSDRKWDGNWSGYCFDAANNKSGLQIHMNVHDDHQTITGSGTDMGGAFIINGRISANTVSFTKGLTTQSWSYNGRKKGVVMYGTWGTKVSGGIFIIG